MNKETECKHYTRLNFLYPLSYLIPAPLVLVFAPKFLLGNFANHHYSIELAPLAGAAMLGFTVMVFNIFYYKVEQLYDSVINVRLPVIAIITWLYINTHDELFLILILTVFPGIIFSSIAKMYDKKLATSTWFQDTQVLLMRHSRQLISAPILRRTPVSVRKLPSGSQKTLV